LLDEILLANALSDSIVFWNWCSVGRAYMDCVSRLARIGSCEIFDYLNMRLSVVIGLLLAESINLA